MIYFIIKLVLVKENNYKALLLIINRMTTFLLHFLSSASGSGGCAPPIEKMNELIKLPPSIEPIFIWKIIFLTAQLCAA